MKKIAFFACLALMSMSSFGQQTLGQRPRVKSPVVNDDGTVTFNFFDPTAQQVSVTGDFEEIRWNTLLRMGGTVAVDRIREHADWDAPRSASMRTFNLWPIPQSVIDTNKDAKIEQNEGWD